MKTSRAAAFLLVSLIATGAAAQEFGRVSGGQVEALTKSATATSGSLGLTFGDGDGYAATFGGTILRDRLWFFGSAQTLPSFTPDVSRPDGEALDAKLTAQLGDRNTVQASFSQLDASVLSLRYDATAASNLFFSGSFLMRRNRQ